MIDTLLQDIKKHYKPIPQKEVTAIYKRATKGDQEAYERLYWSVAGMAVHHAARLAARARRGRDVNLIHELILAGIEGICDGIRSKKYRASKGSWTTYITFYIKGHILRAMYYSDLIRVPQIPKMKGVFYLTQPLSDWDDQEAPVYESPYDPDEIEQLREHVAQLPYRLRVVITTYFLKEDTLVSAGKELGLTRERTRQLKEQGLSFLREIYKVSNELHGD
jgi:RNA polymerase sigma factor (sigma-70 family)